MRILSKILFLFLVIVVLTSCGKMNKNKASTAKQEEILQTDDKTKITKTQFLSFVDSCTEIPANFKTFMSRGVTMDAESFSAPKLSMNIFFERGKLFISTISLAFPPVEVGRASVERGVINVKSNFTEIPSPMNVGFDIEMMLESVMFGKLPPVYLILGQTNFSSFNIYKNGGYYYIEKSDSRTAVKIKMNEDYTLNKIEVKQSQFSAEIGCENYLVVDGVNLPKNLRFDIVYDGKDYIFSLKQRNIEINGSKKLTFE